MNAYNILIGLQDVVYAASMHQLLDEEGYDIDEVYQDAFKILTHIIRYQPAMAIIDHSFPYLTALDIIEAAERKGIATVIVVVLPRLYKGEVDYPFFVRQPFSVDQFLDGIGHWLNEYASY